MHGGRPTPALLAAAVVFPRRLASSGPLGVAARPATCPSSGGS